MTAPMALSSHGSGSGRTRRTVALIGNPNTGKSTLFNRLTGSRERVGNYPGVTVARKSGTSWLGEEEVEVLDLPGTYSLAATSPDERIVTDVLLGRTGDRPALVVCTVDANHLQRSLFLACQMADLCVAVVPLVARNGQGIWELKAPIAAALQKPQHIQISPWPGSVLY
ncbi:MAG: hypothetical protein OHK005_18120 [Candidatus Methylacidiphilales bacterium]